jgi:hypothetical protein
MFSSSIEREFGSVMPNDSPVSDKFLFRFKIIEEVEFYSSVGETSGFRRARADASTTALFSRNSLT